MPEKLFGFLPLNKPCRITSRSAVDVVKKLVRPAKVGHTGTLDPLANGVLVVCVGPATRLATFVQQSKKSYVGTFELGVRSDTDDGESEFQPVENAPVIEQKQLESVLPEFTGTILQSPPAFSAIKIKGKRAYDLARSGEKFEIEPREVNVYSLELIEFDYPDFKLKIDCGAGTYIRSIGRDIGKRLNSAAVMTGLTRTCVGSFLLPDCADVQTLTTDVLAKHLVAPREIFADLPTANLQSDQIVRLVNGGSFEAEEFGLAEGLQRVVAVDQSNNLLALLQSGRTANQYRIEYNFANHYAK